MVHARSVASAVGNRRAKPKISIHQILFKSLVSRSGVCLIANQVGVPPPKGYARKMGQRESKIPKVVLIDCGFQASLIKGAGPYRCPHSY